MSESRKNDSGLFDKDPFPKDVWEIAYKNTGGKPFENGNAFSATEDEKAKASASKLSPEQERLKSELKAKQEKRKAATGEKSKSPESHSATLISGIADSKNPSVTPPSNQTRYYENAKTENDDDEEIDDLDDLITKLLKKPIKEIEKAFAGEEYDKPTVAIAAVVIILAIIIFGLLGA